MFNPFKLIWHGIAGLGKLIAKAFQSAAARGLTDAIVQDALSFVRQAAANIVSNDDKRVWAVSALVSKGVPESIARLAVELAVQLFKDQVVDKIPPPPA